MKIAIRYYTKSGNTKKLADAIGNQLNVEVLTVKTPLTEKVDVLFLGSSVYAAGVDESIKSFIRNNKDNIGISKCEAAASRAVAINKDINISIIYKFITADNFNDLLVNKYDYVIDACDDVNVKVLLMKHANKYKLISSMGTANKTDPSKLCITTLDKTSGDPLAKVLRKRIKDERIRTKFKVVSSTEVPVKKKRKVSDLTEEEKRKLIALKKKKLMKEREKNGQNISYPRS